MSLFDNSVNNFLGRIYPFLSYLDRYTEEERRDPATLQLRKSLNLNDNQSLFRKLEQSIRGYSDLTYIDHDGDLRIMRGNARNIYVLSRIE